MLPSNAFSGKSAQPRFNKRSLKLMQWNFSKIKSDAQITANGKFSSSSYPR